MKFLLYLSIFITICMVFVIIILLFGISNYQEIAEPIDYTMFAPLLILFLGFLGLSISLYKRSKNSLIILLLYYCWLIVAVITELIEWSGFVLHTVIFIIYLTVILANYKELGSTDE